MRDLTYSLVAAAWLVSLATSVIAEPFCKKPNEREAKHDTTMPFMWNRGQYEVEVTVPQVNINFGIFCTFHAVIDNHI